MASTVTLPTPLAVSLYPHSWWCPSTHTLRGVLLPTPLVVSTAMLTCTDVAVARVQMNVKGSESVHIIVQVASEAWIGVGIRNDSKTNVMKGTWAVIGR